MTHNETLCNIAERLQKLEMLIPDEAYVTLFQSLRGDVRDLYDIVNILASNVPGVAAALSEEIRCQL